MTLEKKKTNVDWVAALHSCSLSLVFEKLKREVEDDVNKRQSLRTKGEMYGFSMGNQGSRFVVIVEGHRIHESVTFSLADKKITVADTNDKPIFEAVPTLDDDGECVLKVNGQERELWQVRKMALESIFFRWP